MSLTVDQLLVTSLTFSKVRGTTSATSLYLPQDLPIILGDIQDQASLDKLAAQSSVVVATAGPYARYGTPIVDACVRAGADYCDITGKTSSCCNQNLIPQLMLHSATSTDPR